MKKTFFNVALILTFLTSACNGQTDEPTDTLKLRDFAFNGWFGQKINATTNYNYSLLGSGFFRTPRVDHIDTLIAAWIKEHPNAIIIPVYTFGPTLSDNPNSKQSYCWIVDHSDTLNIFLVRNGAVPAGTMIRPKTWKEMSRKEKKFYDHRPEEEVHVNEQDYHNFMEKLKIADKYARENKLGIYSENEIEKE